MVEAFLRAEWCSRFSAEIESACSRIGIPSAELFHEGNEQIREKVLCGYRSGFLHEPDRDAAWRSVQQTGAYSGGFLNGFRRDAEWRLVELPNGELDALRYSRYQSWINLAGPARRVIDGAVRLESFNPANPDESSMAPRIRNIVGHIEHGKTFEPLIGVESGGGAIVLVEGHSRATAHAIARPTRPLSLLLGNSPRMSEWSFF